MSANAGTRELRTVHLHDDEWATKRLRPESPYPPGHCKTCGLRLSGRRKSFCSDPCSDAWGQRWYSGAVHWLKLHVLLRDGFRCQACGLRPELPWWVRVSRRPSEMKVLPGWGLGAGARTDWTVGEYRVGSRPNVSRLQMHHILPLCEGGDNSDGNLITLCNECHAAAHSGRKAA